MIICVFMGHKGESHLDYIYGSLAREHEVCTRCKSTLKLERPTAQRQMELALVNCFERSV